MLKIVTAVISRDLKLAMRRQADIVSALFFFIIVVSLFPLGVGPEPELLRKLAPGVLWVAALLATSSELLLPMLLTLGLASRLAATGLFVLNGVAVMAYPGMPEAAQVFHLYWGMLLAMLIVYGAGGWSVDRLLVSRLRQ